MRTIVSVQILRAVAASAVVLAHAQSWLSKMAGAPDALPDLHFVGWFAVDLFFVISGFIMVYTSEPMFGRPDGPKTFMLHRLVRIVPFYWLVTAAYAAMSLAFPGFDRSYGLDFIAASFLFIPMLNADGAAMPIVGHGWTLNYEMLFYSVFALTLFAPRRLAVALASGALVAAVILGKLLVPTSTALAFWTSPLILQFIYGMLIGLLYREGLRMAKPLAVALVVAGCASLYLFRYSAVDTPPHVLLAGFSATLVVAGATFGDFSLGGPGLAFARHHRRRLIRDLPAAFRSHSRRPVPVARDAARFRERAMALSRSRSGRRDRARNRDLLRVRTATHAASARAAETAQARASVGLVRAGEPQ